MPHTRHFVTLNDRQMHYRRAGSGPPLVLLHQSPSSSEELVPMIESFADAFTVIAPDTPGFGASDPLPLASPDMDDFAAALIEFFTALGLEKPCVYGFHTGAMIAAALAHRHADRIAVAVMDGFMVLDEEERAEKLAHYFDPPFVPQADGTHMAWLWARFRDQSIFYPWYKREKAARMCYDVSSPERVNSYVRGFLRASEPGVRAYRAAFTYPGAQRVRHLRAPSYLIADDHDMLADHLGRLPANLPAHIKAERLPGPAARYARLRQICRDHGGGTLRSAAETAPRAGRMWRHCVGPAGRQVVVHRLPPVARPNDEATVLPPVLLLHAPGGSARALMPLAQGLAERGRAVWMPDLPGHGLTGDVEGLAPEAGLAAFAAPLAAVIEALAGERAAGGAFDLVACEGSGALGAVLARRHAAAVRSLTIIDPWVIAEDLRRECLERLAPSLTPLWYGGHLLEAWFVVRDSALFWPYFRPRIAHERAGAPDLDPRHLQPRVEDLVFAAPHHRTLTRAALSCDLVRMLDEVNCPLFLAAAETSPHRDGARCFEQRGLGTFVSLPEAMAEWGPVVDRP